jgi:mxaC protein
MNIEFTHPWVLALLPLALIPLLLSAQPVLKYSSLDLIPRDWLSGLVNAALRLLAMAAVCALVLGLAGLNRSQVLVEKLGRGAQIVVLLDRSRSMDQSFSGGRANFDPRDKVQEEQKREPKGSVARRLLSNFTAGRPQDMFGWIVFSTRPLRVLEFTQKQEAIQAAIEAGNIGKGLSDTEIAEGLVAALSYFDDRPYTGSRIVLLVSDGGARIDEAMQRKIKALARRNRVGIYWLYMRSYRSPGLMPDSDADDPLGLAPEHALHMFFKSIGVPYRPYETENPKAVERAIADVNRLENLPLTFTELLPRQDFAQRCYAVALVLVMLLTAAKLLEIRAWR